MDSTSGDGQGSPFFNRSLSVDFKVNNIKTGPAGSLKLDAINLAHESIVRERTAKQEMAKVEASVPEGTIIYKTVGEPIFNCVTKKRIRIAFKAGKYLVLPDNKDKEDIQSTLDYFVEKGILQRDTK